MVPKPHGAEHGRHPRLYFGGASAEAEAVAATEADVQLFWGEPLDDIAARIDRLRALTGTLGRAHAPLEFGLRITTVVRETSDEAWRDARARVDAMAGGAGVPTIGAVHRAGAAGGGQFAKAVGQQRLLDLADRAEVLDSCLYTAPGRVGGGGAATTWLVGAYDEVAAALAQVRRPGHHPLHPLRRPLPARMRPHRRRAAPPPPRLPSPVLTPPLPASAPSPRAPAADIQLGSHVVISPSPG